MSQSNSTPYRLEKELVKIGENITRLAFHFDKNTRIPSQLMPYIYNMFGSLGVYGVGESSKPRKSDILNKNYHVPTHCFTVLYSDKLFDNTHLLVGQSINEWNSSPLYDLIAVTDPVVGRDDEELKVLRILVKELDADKGFDVYDRKTSGIYDVDRTIQLHQTLDMDTIMNHPDKAVKRILAVPRAYEEYIKYQGEKARKEEERINGIVMSILNPSKE